jgi:GNAT superfamily N-acetyltransferase
LCKAESRRTPDDVREGRSKVSVEVIEEGISALPAYEQVSIAFRVESLFDIVPIERGLGGLRFTETAVVPYIKDYDADLNERPTRWPKLFDMSHWGIMSAFSGTQRAGGVTVARKTPRLNLLEQREDLVSLWDLRVHPDYRGQGVGHLLFEHAVAWARVRRCSRMVVETQNINVSACRFYARQGCELRALNRYAYKASDEVQLIWHLDLTQGNFKR